MPLLQILKAVVGNPNFSLTIFPDQNLEREIDREAGDTLRFQDSFELLHGLVHRVIAGYVDDPLASTERHKYLLLDVFTRRSNGTSDRQQVYRHRQSDQCEEESNRDRLGGSTGVFRFTGIQLPDQSKMVPSGKNIYD